MLIEIVICSNEAGAARLDIGDVDKQEDEQVARRADFARSFGPAGGSTRNVLSQAG